MACISAISSVFALVLSLTGVPQVPKEPDFSGEWVLANASGATGEQASALTVTQNAHAHDDAGRTYDAVLDISGAAHGNEGFDEALKRQMAYRLAWPGTEPSRTCEVRDRPD